MRFFFYIAIAIAIILASRIAAQVPVSAGTYAQNFDSLTNSSTANWTNNFTLPGWYASKGNADTTNFTLSAGTSTAGGIYSFATNGINSSADRALGSLGASSTTYAYGVRFTNNTAAAVTNILISYTGEQWRSGSTNTPQILTFAYQISGAPITNTYSATGWTNFPALNFIAPNLSALASAVDGNAVTNRVVFTNIALANITLAPGQEIFLRWLDVDDVGFDNAVALDDLTVSFGTNSPSSNSPPSITAQPTNAVANVGANATFSVTATGTPAPSYQWKLNGTNLLNETNAVLVLNSVATNQVGNYFVTVSNLVSATNSQIATLTVNIVPPLVAAGTNSSLTLMTYNVKGNGVADWSTNAVQVLAIGRQIQFLKPDVITFNEIPRTNVWQMANWVTAFMPGYYLATNSGNDGFINCVIASRHPINRSKSWLDGANLNPFGYTNTSSSAADNFTRDFFEAEINVPNWSLPLHVFTTHLKSSSGGYTEAAAKRAAEAAAITNFLATNFFVLYPAHPFTLSGDMNESDTNTLALQRLISAPTSLRLTNPTNPISGSINTYTIQGSLSERIDFIFPGALLASNITASQVFRTDLLTNFPSNLFSNDDKVASDHLPVLMTFANPFNMPYKFTSVTRTNQSVTLKWESATNRFYAVEASTNLLQWTALASNLFATGTNYTFATNNVSEPLKFFRIYRVP